MNYKCFDTNNDKWLVESVFKGKRNGIFIESGANTGEWESSTYVLEKEFGWTGYMFEPNLTSFNELIKIRNATCINKALYDKECMLEFVETYNSGYSCIKSHIIDWKVYINDIRHKHTIVDCISIPTFFKTYPCPTVIDLFELDAEGTEDIILSKFPFDTHRVNVFIVEESNTRSKDSLLKNNYIQVKNEFNTKCPWETYFFNKEFNYKL